MHTHNHKRNQTIARPCGIAAVLVTLCLLLVLTLNTTTSYAAGAANNRKEAISQALSRSDSGAKVLGVKQIKKENGDVVFAVKVISNGRVKVISIPKTRSE